MRIAVLSGKGGTGKTLVAVNLAALGKSMYIDCDVEEPNGNLFFKAKAVLEEEVKVKIPQVNKDLCNGCRKCVDFCNFNALAYIKDNLIIFEEICHSCGGCTLLCPQKALKEREKPIGRIIKGNAGEISICSGFLNTGEASGVPIIKRLFFELDSAGPKQAFIDCPPGAPVL